LYDYNARYYDPTIGRFVSADSIVPQATNPQALNRYSYVVNNPLKYTDPTGHCFIVCAIVGAAAGALYGYGSQVINNLNNGKDLGAALTTNIDPQGVLLYTAAGAVIGGTAGLVIAPVVYAASGTAGTVATAACADGDCTNELQTAQRVGNQAIESVTKATKIASQLQSTAGGTNKADLLGVKVSGDMSNLANPQVQKALEKINDISTNAERIWKGTWMKREVFEYIKDGVGVVRDRVTGELISITNRSGVDLQKLQDFVDNGTAEWLK
jgi:hypothetical protein